MIKSFRSKETEKIWDGEVSTKLSMDRLPNIHPGEILYEEFMKPYNITAYRLANDMRIPQTRISEIIKKHRRITADTALRLSKYFGVTPQFWLGLQNDYDLEEQRMNVYVSLDSIKSIVYQ